MKISNIKHWYIPGEKRGGNGESGFELEISVKSVRKKFKACQLSFSELIKNKSPKHFHIVKKFVMNKTN